MLNNPSIHRSWNHLGKHISEMKSIIIKITENIYENEEIQKIRKLLFQNHVSEMDIHPGF